MAGPPETEQCTNECKDDPVDMEINDDTYSQDNDQNSSKYQYLYD